jgi:hypothetical protein
MARKGVCEHALRDIKSRFRDTDVLRLSGACEQEKEKKRKGGGSCCVEGAHWSVRRQVFLDSENATGPNPEGVCVFGSARPSARRSAAGAAR